MFDRELTEQEIELLTEYRAIQADDPEYADAYRAMLVAGVRGAELQSVVDAVGRDAQIQAMQEVTARAIGGAS